MGFSDPVKWDSVMEMSWVSGPLTVVGLNPDGSTIPTGLLRQYRNRLPPSAKPPGSLLAHLPSHGT
ncbi:hypothetical protein ONO86_03812 [Micromonospora noduli]|nr:hypothetical protein ONO86_03812 [Micromonospora noduli]